MTIRADLALRIAQARRPDLWNPREPVVVYQGEGAAKSYSRAPDEELDRLRAMEIEDALQAVDTVFCWLGEVTGITAEVLAEMPREPRARKEPL